MLVGDCAGFLVNRLLAPYMNEAGHLVAEVEDPMEVDRAAVEFGMPMGPLELIDLVGLGVSSHVSENMQKAYGERMEPAPLWISLRMAADGKSGPPKVLIKTRFGPSAQSDRRGGHCRPGPPLFRRRKADSRTKRSCNGWSIRSSTRRPAASTKKSCASADDVDLAMVFGTGFAPFRGGPLRYADASVSPRSCETLDRLSTRSSAIYAMRGAPPQGGRRRTLSPSRRLARLHWIGATIRRQHFFRREKPDGGATPTARRGRVFERQTDSHAHAKPWAWHPETQ